MDHSIVPEHPVDERIIDSPAHAVGLLAEINGGATVFTITATGFDSLLIQVPT